MKPHKLFLSLLILLGFAFTTFAQDQIIKTNDDIIICKIKEIGVNELKYTLPDYPSDVTFAIDKDNVRKIIFESGEEMTFQKEMNNPANYLDNKKNAIKIDFLSPLTGNTTFGYEHSIKPGRSFEIGLGIIGLGTNTGYENAGGAFIKTGVKFIKSPDFYLRGMRYAHVLKGSYIKPEISFGYFGYTDYEYDYYTYHSQKVSKEVFSGTLMVNFGKQWVYDNSFLFDWYFGVGYGFGSNDYYEGYYYGYVIADSSFPISFNAGLKMGFLFK
jgi:hypothetical protein